jgi:AcrR family transcriptional regulator
MIYYYFGSKEDLYVAALEESYRRFRQIESDFHIESLAPEPALRKLVGASFDFHAAHPEFVRMVMTENINQGEYIRKIPELRAINRSAISLLDRLCQRGIAEGCFAPTSIRSTCTCRSAHCRFITCRTGIPSASFSTATSARPRCTRRDANPSSTPSCATYAHLDRQKGTAACTFVQPPLVVNAARDQRFSAYAMT